MSKMNMEQYYKYSPGSFIKLMPDQIPSPTGRSQEESQSAVDKVQI